ncbi:hypothetical protein Tco_1342598 [Tanacetum coccineum]
MSWSLVGWVLINRWLIHWGLLLNLGSLDLTLVVAISTVLVLVLVPTILIVGLVVVLHGSGKQGGLICLHVATVTVIVLVEICCGCLREVLLDVISVIVAIARAGTRDVCLSRSRALTISFNSATSGDTPEVEAFRTHLSNNGFASGVTNFGLAFDDA